MGHDWQIGWFIVSIRLYIKKDYSKVESSCWEWMSQLIYAQRDTSQSRQASLSMLSVTAHDSRSGRRLKSHDVRGSVSWRKPLLSENEPKPNEPQDYWSKTLWTSTCALLFSVLPLDLKSCHLIWSEFHQIIHNSFFKPKWENHKSRCHCWTISSKSEYSGGKHEAISLTAKR